MMFDFFRKYLVVVTFLALVLVLVPGLSWLWYQGLINLPPVIVYKAGQVTNSVKVKGVMDVQLPTKVHRKEHSLSCEVATLKMIQPIRGVVFGVILIKGLWVVLMDRC